MLGRMAASADLDDNREKAAFPSLHALHVFEVAARRMSFTEAARELHITQTAVSHQVKALESELGVALFRRGPRRVSLTPSGRAWATELAPIFARLEAAHRKLRGASRRGQGEVALSIVPSFASRWLVPRLGRFLDAHPQIELRISASAHLADFATEPVDLGIRYGSGRYPGLAVEKLASDAWVVVAAPSLLARRRPRAPRDLLGELLLHDDAPNAWAAWLARQGVSGASSERRTEISDSSMLAEAAVRGQGVALARWSLIVDELATGRLELVFPKLVPVPTGRAYYLAAPRENLRRPAVAAFWGWVRREAATLRTRALG
jgi:LysR family transcriptional regulator, glycine cleavage system transcriptional activator